MEKMTLNSRQLVQKLDLLQVIGNSQPEILITMGAGDIDTMVEPIKNLIKTS
jgi:UDP-N-acetylmuramate--alanine ligase